jgi:hypothetical protein
MKNNKAKEQTRNIPANKRKLQQSREKRIAEMEALKKRIDDQAAFNEFMVKIL